MNALVTGGGGYIGSHIVYELIRNGDSVVVLDNLSTGNKESIHQDAKFYEGDQRDVNLLNQIFYENKIDVVIHASARLIVLESMKKPIEYFENNVHGLAIILEVMKKNNVKNIVFSSTAAVYGNSMHDKPLKENQILNPINPYGESKLACEWLIQRSAQAYGFNYTIFRYFNVAGADASGKIGQSTKIKKITHLIPAVIEAQSNMRKKFVVFGNDYDTKDGTCIRDYIHVTDLAKTHIIGAKRTLKQLSGIFNLGSQEGYSVLEVIKTAELTINKPIPYIMSKRRVGDPTILIADISKAKQVLGFKQTLSLADMIESDYKWRNGRKF